MARILFTAPPLTGHINPALAVAQTLAMRGHEVAWAVHADQVAGILPPGTVVHPLGTSAPPGNAAAAQARGLESVRLFFEEYALPMAKSVLEPMEAIARSFQPDVMVVDHQMIGGALVARKLDIPWVTLVTTTASILKMPPMLDGWLFEQFRALQEGYLPAQKPAARPDLSPERVIVFSVEALASQQRVEAPYLFVGPARGAGRRPVEFPWQWLKAEKKKLLVTLGTVSRNRDTRFFEVIMEALADLDLQAILVAPEELAARAPNNVLVRAYVPQLELLDRVDGVICHAGHNTVCEALARGLPLIVAPIREDQPWIARQVIDAGAGIFMRHGKVTPAAARGAIQNLLGDPAYAASAKKLSVELQAAPGEQGAARVVEDLATT